MFQCCDHVSAVTTERAVIAIVHQDDVSRAHSRKPRDHSLRGLRLPVVTQTRPRGDAAKLQRARYATELRPAKSEGRPHPLHRERACAMRYFARRTHGRAKRLPDGLFALSQLLRDARSGKPNEVRMGVRVIGEQMPARGDLAHQLRAFRGESPDDEKSGARVVAREQVEQPRGNGRIRPVIKGKSNRVGRCAPRVLGCCLRPRRRRQSPKHRPE